MAKPAEGYVTLAVQQSGGVRTEELMGREFRVFPAVLVREQVLNNNLGRTFLPAEEITEGWASTANGAPVIIDHPTSRGMPISARSPDVLNARGTGFLFRARVENARMKADVFLDPARATAVGALVAILAKLDKGETVELSTGFPLRGLDETPGVFNGREYDLVLRPAGFDHLAIFADKQGACSISDGCGLGVNHADGCAAEEEEPMQTTDEGPPTVGEGPEVPAWQRFVAAAAEMFGIQHGEQEGKEDGVAGAEEEDDRGSADAANATEQDHSPGGSELEDASNDQPEGKEYSDMDRTKLIAQLVEAGPLDEEALGKLSDCQLKALASPRGQDATNTEPEGDGWDVARDYRRQLEELKLQTANAVESEQKERTRLLDDVLYAKDCPWTENEIKAMGINELRKVHAALCKKADYSLQGGPRGSGGPTVDFVRPILDGHRGESVLDRKEAN